MQWVNHRNTPFFYNTRVAKDGVKNSFQDIGPNLEKTLQHFIGNTVKTGCLTISKYIRGQFYFLIGYLLIKLPSFSGIFRKRMDLKCDTHLWFDIPCLKTVSSFFCSILSSNRQNFLLSPLLCFI